MEPSWVIRMAHPRPARRSGACVLVQPTRRRADHRPCRIRTSVSDAAVRECTSAYAQPSPHRASSVLDRSARAHRTIQGARRAVAKRARANLRRRGRRSRLGRLASPPACRTRGPRQARRVAPLLDGRGHARASPVSTTGPRVRQPNRGLVTVSNRPLWPTRRGVGSSRRRPPLARDPSQRGIRLDLPRCSVVATGLRRLGQR
jgi:hypothetical protein